MKKRILSNILVLCLVVMVNTGYEGHWIMDDEKFMIHIVKNQDGIYEGYVDWLKYPTYPEGDKMEGMEQFDRNNDDESLRDRKILGLQNVGDLKMDEDGRLKGGWVYDTWNGNMYYGSAKLLDDDTLSLKGSLDKWGILGYSMKSHRVKDENLGKYFTNHVEHHK